MKNIFKSMALMAGVAALSMTAAMAQQSDALIDALVKKGVLSDQEAEEIRVDLSKEYNATSAGKIQLSSFISKLQLFGDARLRYEYLNARTPAAGNNGLAANADRDRFRYRLRLGATYTYDSHWSATVRLETATANNSTNVDFGRYFDKYGDSINVGLVYLEYQNQWSLFDSTSTVANGKSYSTVTDPGFTLTTDWRVGKAPKQILLSEAFWDGDTNPEGVAQEFGFTNIGVDGLSLYARGAEYFPGLANGSTGGSTTGIGNDEIGSLLIGQLEVKYAWDSNSNVRIAPMFMTETEATLGTTATLNQEVDSGNSTGITPTTTTVGAHPYNTLGRLAVAAVPIEVNFKLFGQPNQVWGTYGANLEGQDRLNSLGYQGQHGQNTFWNAGYQIGQSKKKGDWMASAEYRWIETASYTPNLSESDWADNTLNQQGFVLRAGYNLTDFLFGQVSFYHSNPIETGPGHNGSLPAGGVAYAGAGTYDGQVDRVQVDLSWKF